MAWTYTHTPATDDIDAVRMLSGDIDENNPATLHDEEIQWWIDQERNLFMAAAEVAANIAGRLAGYQKSQSMGSISISWGDRAKDYKERAAQLRVRGQTGRVPEFRAQSIDDKRSLQEDADRVPPAFRRGLHDNRESAEDDLSAQYVDDPIP